MARDGILGAPPAPRRQAHHQSGFPSLLLGRQGRLRLRRRCSISAWPPGRPLGCDGEKESGARAGPKCLPRRKRKPEREKWTTAAWTCRVVPEAIRLPGRRKTTPTPTAFPTRSLSNCPFQGTLNQKGDFKIKYALESTFVPRVKYKHDLPYSILNKYYFPSANGLPRKNTGCEVGADGPTHARGARCRPPPVGDSLLTRSCRKRGRHVSKVRNDSRAAARRSA